MSDLARPRVTDEFVAAVFAVMGLAEGHRFQILAKRPRRFRALLGRPGFRRMVAGAIAERDGDRDLTNAVRAGDPAVWPLRSVWLGVSAEDDARTRKRLPLLADTPAAVRFVSAEPLLEDITDGLQATYEVEAVLGRMDWVIVGGESGRDCRPMHANWARHVRDACLALGVSFFFKQWGGRTPKAGGRQLDGRTCDGLPRRARPNAEREGRSW